VSTVALKLSAKFQKLFANTQNRTLSTLMTGHFSRIFLND